MARNPTTNLIAQTLETQKRIVRAACVVPEISHRLWSSLKTTRICFKLPFLFTSFTSLHAKRGRQWKGKEKEKRKKKEKRLSSSFASMSGVDCLKLCLYGGCAVCCLNCECLARDITGWYHFILFVLYLYRAIESFYDFCTNVLRIKLSCLE